MIGIVKFCDASVSRSEFGKLLRVHAFCTVLVVVLRVLLMMMMLCAKEGDPKKTWYCIMLNVKAI